MALLVYMGSLVGAEDGVKDVVSKLSTGQDEAVKWSQKLARYGLGAKVDSYLVYQHRQSLVDILLLMVMVELKSGTPVT